METESRENRLRIEYEALAEERGFAQARITQWLDADQKAQSANVVDIEQLGDSSSERKDGREVQNKA